MAPPCTNVSCLDVGVSGLDAEGVDVTGRSIRVILQSVASSFRSGLMAQRTGVQGDREPPVSSHI